MKTEKTQIVRTTAVLFVAAGMISLFVIAKRPVALSATIPSASREVRSKIYFEQNRGQVDERAKFISRGAGPTMFLAATEAVYVLPMPSEEDGEKGRRGDMESAMADASFRRDVPASPRLAFALRMQFVGSNPAAEVSGDGELVTRANYFRGNDPSRWLTDVPAFSRVRYDDVYPDIDLEFYGNRENKSQYDFIVQPNADASRIELEFAGAESVAIEPESGDLLINTAAGTIKQSSPFSYQQTNGAKHAIVSSYELTGRTSVRFRLGEYDRSKPLVIDPALNNLAFSSYLGGGNSDIGYDIEVDAAGNVYVVGTTNSDLFPTTTGVFDTTFNGFSDIFISKMAADGGGLIYSTYVGGNGQDDGYALEIDASGSTYLTGRTTSTNFPVTAGAFDPSANLDNDVFVTKLNATGNGLIYSTYLGGISSDRGFGIAVDSAGSAFVSGDTGSTDFPTQPGSFDTSYGSNNDIFLTKLNPSGTALVYSTFFGGDGSEVSSGIVVDNAGNAVITGATSGGTLDGGGFVSFPTTIGAFDRIFNGANDAFVSKFNPAGTALVFSTFIGGTGFDSGEAIALDTNGNCYITGTTSDTGSGFPIVNAYDSTLNSQDAFVTKLVASGSSLAYSTFLGGDSLEFGGEIFVDSLGSAYVVGTTYSVTGFTPTSNAYDSSHNGGPADAFVSKLNPGGSNLSYMSFLGGTASDSGNGIALDIAGNVYVTGTTSGQTFPTTATAFQTEYAGFGDAFVAKLGNFAISGRAVDVSGAAVPNATIALSGSSSETKLTDAGGNFSFLDALPNRYYTVSASRAGTVFNPSLFNLPILNDNRTLIFVAGGAPGGGGGSNLSFAANSFSSNESGGATVVRVWRDSGTIASTVTVNYATSDATANAGPDYVAASGTLTFAPGVTERTFNVFVRDDVLTEGTESLNLTLSNPTGGATLGTSAAALNIDDNGEPQIQSGGYSLGIVSIPGSLKNRHIVGIAASNTDGTVFVATDNNFIEPPSGLTNNCGTQPVQSSFDLFRILPNNNTNLLGNYQIPHRSLVNLELNPADGLLYTVGTDRKVYSINPAGGPATVFNSDVGFDTDRYGLEADAGGNLIMMQYGSPNSFYRVSAGTGATFLGSYPNDLAANFGDRFGIQPDGDYVIYSDAPAGRTPREFEIDTTGHIDGSPFNFNYLTGSNMRTLGSSYLISNGATNPVTGDVFSSGGNCSAGSSVIIATSAGGNSSSASSTFISGIGNNYTDGADNFNARGVTDLDFGARRDGLPGKCLYFADDFNDVIYSACGFAPTAANVAVSGRVFSPDGFGLRNASVSITDTHGNVRSTLTGSFGYFRFDEIVAGESYVVAVTSKRYVFTPRIVNPTDELTDVDFVPQ